MPVKHRFQSGKGDGTDTTLVRPSNWNDGHDGLGPTAITLVGGLDATVAATNLAAGAFNAVSDPSLRAKADLRGVDTIKVLARIGGSLVAATKIRFQYHTNADPNIATGDAGWTTLGTSAGSHTLGALFEFSITVPAGAKIADCTIRVGLFDGDGVADPTITMCRVRAVY